MESKAIARYVRVSPRKARFVIDAIRGLHVQDALDILKFTPNSAAKAIEKVIKSAKANAENNLHINGDEMRVAHARVDEGPTLKRIQPRAMGRAYRILKRTSHISVVLEETEAPPKRLAKKEPARRGRAAAKAAKPKAEGKPKAEPKPKAEAKPKAETGPKTEEKPKRGTRKPAGETPEGGE